MNDAASTDSAKQAREALGTAHAHFTAASKRGLADDAKIFFGAAVAIDLAVEALLATNVDRVLAAQSCREALKLVKLSRAYAQRAAGGSIAQLLDDAMKKVEGALKFVERDPNRGVP